MIFLKQLLAINKATFERFLQCDISTKALEQEYLTSKDFTQKATEAVEQINQTVLNVCADPKSQELKDGLKNFGQMIKYSYQTVPDDFYNTQIAFLNMLGMGLK